MTWKLKLLLLTLSSVYLITNGQKESTDDLTFTYKDRPEIDPPRTSTRRSHMSRPSRTSSIRPQTKLPVSMPAPHQKTSTSKSHGSILTPGSILLQVQQQANLPPFIYAQETLNQTHANMFAQWIDAKSAELYELSMNYSGFKILDETYKANLLREARPAWINFTEMIMNISKTISEVLNHKTLIVKNLTDLVEKAFDEYRNDPEKILESTKTLYYDAKSPKTFCDVQEATNARAAKLNQTIANSSATTTTTTTTTTKSVLDKV